MVKKQNQYYEQRQSTYIKSSYDYSDNNLESLLADLNMISEIFGSKERIEKLRDYSQDMLIRESNWYMIQLSEKYHELALSRLFGKVFPELKSDEDTRN